MLGHGIHKTVLYSVMETYFSQLTGGLTGNVYLDAIIASHIFPFIISYFKAITGLISKLFIVIGDIIYGYVKQYISTKLGGKNVMFITIDAKDTLFMFIKDYIFVKSVVSDIQTKKSKFSLLTNILKVKLDEKRSYWKTLQKINRECYEMAIDYEEDSLLAFKKCSDNYFIDKEKKYFAYKNCEFTIILLSPKANEMSNHKKPSEGQRIKIKIVDNKFNKSNLLPIKKYMDLLEQFLSEKFNMKENIYYNYTVEIGRHLSSHFQQAFPNTSYYMNTVSQESYIKRRSSGNSNKYTLDISCDQFTDENTRYSNYVQLNNTKNSNSHSQLKFFRANYGSFTHNTILTFDDMEAYFFCTQTEQGGKGLGHIGLSVKGRILSQSDIIQIIEKIIQESISMSKRKSNLDDGKKKNSSIFRYKNKKWAGIEMGKRSFDTIYLPRKIKKQIKKEIEMFIKKKELYEEYQIPYKKGMLFYGPPGTGKTSIVKSLAYEYSMDVYMLNINDPAVNDESINDILNSIGGTNNKILLFEDIDSAFSAKEKLTCNTRQYVDKDEHQDEPQGSGGLMGLVNYAASLKQPKQISSTKDSEKHGDDKDNDIPDSGIKIDTMTMINPVEETKYLTYSGLLNALDGVMSNQTGVITIMTTNYIEKLGKAFLRPGRIDCKFELKECNDEQINDMILCFIEKSSRVLKNIGGRIVDMNVVENQIKNLIPLLVDSNGMSNIKPCQLQFYILRYIDNIDDIFTNYRELLVNDD